MNRKEIESEISEYWALYYEHETKLNFHDEQMRCIMNSIKALKKKIKKS